MVSKSPFKRLCDRKSSKLLLSICVWFREIPFCNCPSNSSHSNCLNQLICPQQTKKVIPKHLVHNVALKTQNIVKENEIRLAIQNQALRYVKSRYCGFTAIPSQSVKGYMISPAQILSLPSHANWNLL